MDFKTATDRVIVTAGATYGAKGQATMEGELVTEALEYDGGRQVTVYLPPTPPEVVVFAGDGQLISQWGDFVAAAGAPSMMIVGVHGRTRCAMPGRRS